MPAGVLPRPSRTTASPADGIPRRRTRALALAEARWAGAALALFLLALPLDLTGAPGWTWGPLYALVYAAGGWEPALSGLRELREKVLDVDLLMIVSALGAASIGQVRDGALLIVIFAASGALEALATARTQDAVRGLLDLAPATATRIGADGGEESVATEDLVVGDVIRIRPGERVGADGRVLDGASEVDQATITGEPLPTVKELGDTVFAGTLNGTGTLRVAVERDASASVIARIVAMTEEASRTKAPTQLFIEKVEQRYSLGMVAATLAVFLVPLLLGGDMTDGLLRAMTFMIVASPCAVVLATMPPLLSAMANAGRHGVLVKSAVVMERLGQADAVALDKTGTLTEGTPRVTRVLPLPGSGLTADALLTLAAAAEHPSEHPLARAVVNAAQEGGLPLLPATGFTSEPGTGVVATVGDHRIAAGSPARLLRDPAAPEAPEAAEAAAAAVAGLEETGCTAVLVLRDGVPVGVLGISDRIRRDAASTVASLARLTGGSPVLLTGDHPRAAARLAAEAGITDVRAGLLPQDKAAAVREQEQAGRRVLVVGDGVNDAPALAAAHIGIAMGRAGSDLALETADAVIIRDELATVPAVVALSRATRRLVVQNLAIAGLFISVLAVWDLAGHLPLPLGVLGHEGSTVLVGLNGLRLLRESAWRRAAGLGGAGSPGRALPATVTG
ncbi:ATPase, P-type (transporting), HAD superfamily, subfamily IC/heavy metal translocating P-type ATPase [Streptomyces sp. LamerLS-316]|uniref:heavy metal translocating P-type ATPase n=1 Tax=unclassified Streptomyces TaxID=2593676 RepID=UPI0008237ADC|nr:MULTISPECIES: heavy metal translocating P-type ATPase [unclassified Streptomyces]MYQ39721.1 heavy metal translocating P-type ATPase [Streptomyces sp. SID4921]SCK17978.1 ATPase, P-type (transporting), HAD superfamily, subfamily IC/heavy metal translocating P-type ATPase [Streptomyces sp. LamerLS-316]